ncbi:MAG: autotransporter domain-containing protein [Candidatus Omnitrophica bacterium]|nr:autotransporter domain-containing protein [Candidatus Omnitrophota bacterium]
MAVIRKLVILTFIVVLYCCSLLCGRAYATTPWSFAVIGDTRGADTTTTTGVSEYLPAIASVITNPSSVQTGAITPSAVFVSGDLINGNDLLNSSGVPDYRIQYDTQFANWKSTAYGMGSVYAAGIPVYTVRGNHENNADDGLPPDSSLHPTTLTTAYYNALGSSMPTDGPAGQVGYTWTKVVGNVRIIAVDQYFYYNATKQGTSNYYQIDQDWLNTQLAAPTTAKYTLVMAHEPVFYLDNALGDFYGSINSNGSANAAGVAARQTFWNSLGSNGVKMYLCSHVHNVEVGTSQDSSGNTIYQNESGNGGAPFEAQGTTDSNLNVLHQDFTNFGFELFTVSDNGIIIDYYVAAPVTSTTLGPWSVGYGISVGSDFQSKATNSNAASVGAALDNGGLITPDMSNVLKTLEAASDSQIASSLNTMYPIVDRGVIETTNGSLDKFVEATVLRLQDSKAEEGKDKSKSSDNTSLENSIWAQTYGDYANQDARGSSNGYLARLWGTAIGFDRSFLGGRLRLGFAQGFAGSQILSGDSSGRTGITSFQSCLYGEYEGRKHPYVLDTVLSYGHNDFDSSRSVTAPGINRIASSDYHGDQFSSYLEGGYKFKKKNFDITPLLAIGYTHLHISGYTESGADSFGLNVDAQNYDTLQVGTGCRISRAYETKNMLITPELHFRYFYAVINDKQQTLASFVGGSTSFQTNGYRPAPSSFNLGARFEFFDKKNITMLADCDTSFKDSYYEAGGSLTVKYSF